MNFLQADPNIINEKNRSIKDIGRSMMLVLSDHLGKQGFDELGMFANRFVTPFYERVFPNIKHKSSTAEDFANLVVDLKA